MARTRAQTGQKPQPSLAPKNQGKQPQGIRKSAPRKRGRLHEQPVTKRTGCSRPSPSAISQTSQGLSAPVQNRGRKRKQSIENALEPNPDPGSKRRRTSPTRPAEDALSKPAISSGASKHIDPIAIWAEQGRWPKEQDWPERTSERDSAMDRLLARKKSSSNLSRKRSNSATSTTPSDQKSREEKSAPYRDARYPLLLQTKGSYMGKSPLGIAGHSRRLCETLLNSEQPAPRESLFENDVFETVCDNLENKNEARVVQDISRLIVPSLLRDIEGFLHQGAPAWHLSRGIPYRKGYLLYGPPGTGKSSLCLSLAGRFDLDVYILNISAIDGRSLSTLLVELPSRCVLLLEDVDAVGISQPRQGETDFSKTQADAARNQPRSQGKLSLSELLNALDGVSSHEGRLLMMTTNHLDHLDRALIRAGRVDKKIELPNADKDMIFRLFCMIFKQSEGEILHLKQAAEDDETEQYGHEFARKTPEGEFSPAEIQSFLVEHRGSARVAVEKVQEWIDRTRAERAKMARAGLSLAVSPFIV